MITILVAHDDSRVIGNKGTIPWKISEELQLFRKRTVNNFVVMGRKTWESLPMRPLPGRVNAILSTTYSKHPERLARTLPNPFAVNQVLCFKTLENCLRFLKISSPQNEIFIIGGAQVYQEALDKDLVDKIIVSKIPGTHDGDIFFPEIDDWACKQTTEYDKFSVVEYRKG